MAGQTPSPAGIFLLDIAMDALMLILALRLGSRKLRFMRILAGALVGAMLSLAVSRLPLSLGRAALAWPVIALVMMILADGRASALRPVRSVLLLLGAAGLLGGVVLSLYGAVGALLPAYALGAAAVLVIAASVCRERRSAQDVRALRIRIRTGGSQAEFDALCDSGNCLRDYLTHRPVIVLPERLARERLRLQTTRLRPIFADTAGGRQMMWLFLPEEAAAIIGGETRLFCAAVALSPGLRDSSPALVPASLIE